MKFLLAIAKTTHLWNTFPVFRSVPSALCSRRLAKKDFGQLIKGDFNASLGFSFVTYTGMYLKELRYEYLDTDYDRSSVLPNMYYFFSHAKSKIFMLNFLHTQMKNYYIHCKISTDIEWLKYVAIPCNTFCIVLGCVPSYLPCRKMINRGSFSIIVDDTFFDRKSNWF